MTVNLSQAKSNRTIIKNYYLTKIKKKTKIKKNMRKKITKYQTEFNNISKKNS